MQLTQALRQTVRDAVYRHEVCCHILNYTSFENDLSKATCFSVPTSYRPLSFLGDEFHQHDRVDVDCNFHLMIAICYVVKM